MRVGVKKPFGPAHSAPAAAELGRLGGYTHRCMDVVLRTNAEDPAFVLCNCRRVDSRTYQCKLYVRSSGFIAERQFWFEEPEFGTFLASVAEMDRTLEGSAELRTRYEENGFRLDLAPRGTVTVSGTLREYGATEQVVHFAFTTDQTVLGPFARDLTQLSLLEPPNERCT
jgi:hypothetical protein